MLLTYCGFEWDTFVALPSVLVSCGFGFLGIACKLFGNVLVQDNASWSTKSFGFC